MSCRKSDSALTLGECVNKWWCTDPGLLRSHKSLPPTSQLPRAHALFPVPRSFCLLLISACTWSHLASFISTSGSFFITSVSVPTTKCQILSLPPKVNCRERIWGKVRRAAGGAAVTPPGPDEALGGAWKHGWRHGGRLPGSRGCAYSHQSVTAPNSNGCPACFLSSFHLEGAETIIRLIW